MRTVTTAAVALTALLTLSAGCQSGAATDDGKPVAASSPSVDREANKKQVCAEVAKVTSDFKKEVQAAAAATGDALMSDDEAAAAKAQQQWASAFKNLAVAFREQESKAVDSELKSQLGAAAVATEAAAAKMAKGADATKAEEEKFEAAATDLDKTCKL